MRGSCDLGVTANQTRLADGFRACEPCRAHRFDLLVGSPTVRWDLGIADLDRAGALSWCQRQSRRAKLVSFVARAVDFDRNGRNPRKPDGPCSCRRKIDDPPAHEWAAVSDGHDNGAPVISIGDASGGAEWQRGMRRRQCFGVQVNAARGPRTTIDRIDRRYSCLSKT